MEILNLIKKRSSIRTYQNRKVSDKKLKQIIEAAVWGPSLVGFQPGSFVIIKDNKTKKALTELLKKNLKKLGVSGRVIFMPKTIHAIETAPILILAYSSNRFVKLLSRFYKYGEASKQEYYLKIAEQAETSAVSAAIQNMILTIESMGLASCWLHLPLYCEAHINKLLKTKNKLIALLTIGYAKEKGKRSNRNLFNETIRII